jgi:hypothetical protein
MSRNRTDDVLLRVEVIDDGEVLRRAKIYDGATLVLQWYCASATKVLQRCHNIDTVGFIVRVGIYIKGLNVKFSKRERL